jgi:Zn-dependent peptidase ImmA (M78 family)/transcriptional regulator with XRE-family HTH domain
MKVGTPGFVGERLRAARAARGIPAADLAASVGVSRAAVTQYEKGRQSPSPPIARLISEKLDLPLHHFLRPVSLAERGAVFFRSLSSATKAARTRAQQLHDWFREIVDHLRLYVKFPTVNIPDFDALPRDPHSIRQENIEDAANEMRRSWGVSEGPVGNLVLLLEKNGVIAERYELQSDKLDAFSEWNSADRTPYVVLNSEKASAVRSRFDAAHELAHLILHKSVSRANLQTPRLFAIVEDQANRFGGAFLLPEKSFASDLNFVTLDLLRALKAKWRVSVGVMIKRAAHLRVISAEEERRLWIAYSRRGWRKREPMDDQLEEERPRYVRRCIELLVEKEIIAREDLPFHLALPAADIERLVGLPSGFFQPVGPAIQLATPVDPTIVPFASPGLRMDRNRQP